MLKQTSLSIYSVTDKYSLKDIAIVLASSTDDKNLEKTFIRSLFNRFYFSTDGNRIGVVAPSSPSGSRITKSMNEQQGLADILQSVDSQPKYNDQIQYLQHALESSVHQLFKEVGNRPKSIPKLVFILVDQKFESTTEADGLISLVKDMTQKKGENVQPIFIALGGEVYNTLKKPLSGVPAANLVMLNTDDNKVDPKIILEITKPGQWFTLLTSCVTSSRYTGLVRIIKSSVS